MKVVCVRKNGYKLIMVGNRNMPKVLDLTKDVMNHCIELSDLLSETPSRWFGPLLGTCLFVVNFVCPMVWEYPPLLETDMSKLSTVQGQAQRRLYEVCVT